MEGWEGEGRVWKEGRKDGGKARRHAARPPVQINRKYCSCYRNYQLLSQQARCLMHEQSDPPTLDVGDPQVTRQLTRRALLLRPLTKRVTFLLGTKWPAIDRGSAGHFQMENNVFLRVARCGSPSHHWVAQPYISQTHLTRQDSSECNCSATSNCSHETACDQ